MSKQLPRKLGILILALIGTVFLFGTALSGYAALTADATIAKFSFGILTAFCFLVTAFSFAILESPET